MDGGSLQMPESLPGGEVAPPMPLPGLRHVLVGLDDRGASRDALVLAQAICDRGGARLSTITVAAGEDPARAIKDAAVSGGADLIVAGSTHRGKFGQVLTGSVGERVLDGAPCAVAVAPLGLAERGLRLRRIAVGYDGSREAAGALRVATELAERAGCDLLILGAAPIQFDVTGFEEVSPDLLEEGRVRGHLQRARRRVPKSVQVEARVLRGEPSQVIVEAAADADLLVLGSRGHYGVARRVFLGSVATQVTRSAPCATLVVPSP